VRTPATPFSFEELARRIGAEPRGRAVPISGVAPLESAGPSQIAFYSNPRYRKELQATRAGAVIVCEDDVAHVPASAARLVSAQPYVAFAKASALFHAGLAVEPGIQKGALIDDTAEVHPTAAISPGAYVGPGARIGSRTTLHAGARVLDCARVGEDCVLWPGAVVREHCIVGDRVILQPNAVVGSDGFGFAFDLAGDGNGPMHRKVPQAGIVRVEDDVEVGACSCIDRATLGETVIGRGTKIDNLVQLGQGVVLAGQVGVVGHLRIGDGARAGAQAGVAHDVADGETVTGYPAIPHRDWLRMSVALPRVPELLREVRRLQQRVEQLEKERE